MKFQETNYDEYQSKLNGYQSNYDGYQSKLGSMVHKFLEKKTGLKISVNEQQAKKLHKLVIKKVRRRMVYAEFRDNIWAADLAEMGPLSSKKKILNSFYCA